MSSRDTQFAGFARALVDELRKIQHLDVPLQSEKIIAQRAYDLVEHTCTEIERIEDFNEKFWMGRIPDFTEFPGVTYGRD